MGPREVQFAHPAPRETAEHATGLRGPVAFGAATNAFVFEREFAERQVPTADERLYPILKRYLDQRAAETPREDGLLASVRRAVGEVTAGRQTGRSGDVARKLR